MKIKTKEIDGERYICINDLEKLFEITSKSFISILSQISLSYYSQNEFARACNLDAGYISKLLSGKRERPVPDTLRQIAKASKGITTYKELMQVCGYLDGINE